MQIQDPALDSTQLDLAEFSEYERNRYLRLSSFDKEQMRRYSILNRQHEEVRRVFNEGGMSKACYAHTSSLITMYRNQLHARSQLHNSRSDSKAISWAQEGF